MSEEKKFPLTVTGMWRPKSGKNYYMIANITPGLIEKLEKVDETGMLIFKPVEAEPGTNRPDAYLEYLDAEQKDQFFGGNEGGSESEGI